MGSDVLQAVSLLRTARHVVALTGAGISTPSGIPDFRSERHGLWRQVDPLDVASLWGFRSRPERFYAWLRALLEKTVVAHPNAAHVALARLEAEGRLAMVITQNIDSLHQAAGSQSVLELHGHTRTATCLSCGESIPSEPVLQAIVANSPPPGCAHCGGLLKPDVVLFGEPIPYDSLAVAQQHMLLADLVLIIGTSLEVMPAADLPLLAKRRGARLILINRTPTPLDDQMDVIVRDDVVHAMRALASLA